jgi:hypothetical protein
MRLETEDAVPIDAPSEADIETMLTAMGDSSFVILSRGDVRYMQTAPGVVEYRDGDKHYRYVPDEYDRSEVRDLFVAYLQDQPAWQTSVEWVDVTQELYGSDVAGTIVRRSFPVAPAVLLLLVLVALAIWLLW